MRTSLTRAVAITAAAAAALAVAGPASAATHQPPKTPTTLSITESKTSITPGGTDTIHGTLQTGTKPVAKKTVYLDYYSSSAKKWVPAHAALTNGAGRVAFTVKPTGTTKYELVFRGSATLASAHSGAATVLVTKTSTTLSVTEASAVIYPGKKDVIGGLLLAGATPVARAAVRLYRYSASARKWVLHDTSSTSRTGVVSFSVTPQSSTSYELVSPGSSTLASAHSGVATVVVTKLPTTLSIREAAATIAAGHVDVISGVLLTGPTPVTRHLVYLYYYSSSAKKWLLENVALTSSAGKVAFTVKPRTSVEYQLVFKGTAGLYAANSGVATVTVTN